MHWLEEVDVGEDVGAGAGTDGSAVEYDGSDEVMGGCSGKRGMVRSACLARKLPMLNHRL